MSQRPIAVSRAPHPLSRGAATRLRWPHPERAAIVAIAASAGGIPAISRILSGLPRDYPIPIVLVLHRGASVPTALPRILARETLLAVKLAEAGEALRPATVYVAPADRHMLIDEDGRLQLMDGRKIKFVSSSANPLFDSAAAVLGGQVIAVVLTGGGSNGTDGVQAIKATGGVVIAQDPVTAAHGGMPSAAIASGAVDYVLELGDIAPALIALGGEGAPDHAAR
ncbi:MAG TPA: chemotaxis protein CheB [Gemmatimonadaceae bacterium]|nr:chemotaxis protein CheB [Gemmatimonadaceae bacterium]